VSSITGKECCNQINETSTPHMQAYKMEAVGNKKIRKSNYDEISTSNN